VGLRAGLDWCGKSRPTGIRSPDRPAHRQSLYRLRYPAHYILALGCIKCKIFMVHNQAPGNEAWRKVGMALRVLNLASKCRSHGTVIPSPPYSREKIFYYPLNRKLGGPWRRSERAPHTVRAYRRNRGIAPLIF